MVEFIERKLIDIGIFKPTDGIYLLLLCFLSGFAQLIGPNKAVDNLVPNWLELMWAIVLITGSGICLIGIMWSKQPKGILIELAGRWMLWPPTLAYAIAIIWYNHNLVGAIFVAGFGVTCIMRARFIERVIQRWNDEIPEILRKHDDPNGTH